MTPLPYHCDTMLRVIPDPGPVISKQTHAWTLLTLQLEFFLHNQSINKLHGNQKWFMLLTEHIFVKFHNYWGDDGRKVALLAIIAPQFQSLAPTTQNWRTMWSFILTTIARTQHDHNLLERMDLIGCLMYFNWGILCLWCVSIDGQDAVEDAIIALRTVADDL